MDFYSIFKLLHVLSAVVWVGGGFCMAVLGIVASSRNDEAEALRVVNNVAFLANRLFMPASIATLAFGAIAAWLGGMYGAPWIWIGLGGFAGAFLTGSLVLGPNAARMVALQAEGRTGDAFAVGRLLLNASKFDYALMAVVISDMVLKPGLGDVGILAVMALVLVAAALLFLPAALRATPRAA